MNHNELSPVVTLPFAKGTYTCVWNLPIVANKPSELKFYPAAGDLDLGGGKSPRGSYFGELPIEWDDNEGASLPQVANFDSLTGSLSNGGYVALLNGQRNYWIHRKGYAEAAFAILSRQPFGSGKPIRYSAIQLQFEGLDEIVDVAPIEVSGPRVLPTPPCYQTTESTCFTVEIVKDREVKWSAENVSMSIGYDCRFDLDCLDFRVRSSPVLRVSSSSPLIIEDWWKEWIMPLRDLMTAILGKMPDVTFLLAIRDGDKVGRSGDQVFCRDISQTVLQPNMVNLRRSKAPLHVRADEVDLLSVFLRRRDLEVERHPLVETFASVAVSYDQHPRSRYLLLIQALEGLHGFDNKEANECSSRQYKEKRKHFLERVGPKLSDHDLEHLKDNLRRSPYSSLEKILIELLGTLVTDVREDLEACSLVNRVRQLPESKGSRVEKVLAEVRNKLSHGATEFVPDELEEVAVILDRVVRAEYLRIVGAPKEVLSRILSGGI